MKLHRAAIMWPEKGARCDVRSPICHTRAISLLLLLILAQMTTSLVFFAGVFVRTDEVIISPYKFCEIHQSGELSCDDVYESHLYEQSQSQGAESETLSKPQFNTSRIAVYLAIYFPVILVGFALMGMYSVIFDKDEPALFCSVNFQVLATLLTLAGIIGFLHVYQSYMSWKNSTIWFYISVGVVMQLAITAVLTHMSRKGVKSYWKYNEMVKPVPA